MATSKSNLSAKEANALRRLADRYNATTAKADELRVQLDAMVLATRESGGTFREIASLASRSVAWVQGSLQRSGERAN